MTLRQILSENIKRMRAERGWSQEDLADAAQIDRTYVSSLERCRYSVSLDILERLAKAFGTDAWQLLKSELV